MNWHYNSIYSCSYCHVTSSSWDFTTHLPWFMLALLHSYLSIGWHKFAGLYTDGEGMHAPYQHTEGVAQRTTPMGRQLAKWGLGWERFLEHACRIIFKKYFYFKITFDLQKSCSDSKESSCVVFTQFPNTGILYTHGTIIKTKKLKYYKLYCSNVPSFP